MKEAVLKDKSIQIIQVYILKLTFLKTIIVRKTINARGLTINKISPFASVSLIVYDSETLYTK